MIAEDGTLRKVCRNYELVENYEKAVADEEKWELHHRRETDENKKRKELIAEGRYYNVEPEELIFLTREEHNKLHHIGKKHTLGYKHTEETKKKISESQLGEKNHMFGKHLSEIARNKISEALKGEKHPFYGKRHSEASKKKMSESRRGEKNSSYKTFWWNNGMINKRSKEQPGPDFVRGRLKFNK